MKKYWEQLKPQERRWLVAIGCVVFLMLNYFFVWPHFGDWRKADARIADANKQIETYSKEVRNKPVYQRKINDLQADGSSVLPEDQAIDFIHFYSSRAISNHVVVTTQGALTTRTNQFFLEQQMGVNVVADETNLVNFLYSLGAGTSMMRVRAMSLRPDQGHQNLNASITLVASYQKKPELHPATKAAPARTAAIPPPATKPAPVPGPQQQKIMPTTRTNRFTNMLSRLTGIASTNKPGH